METLILMTDNTHLLLAAYLCSTTTDEFNKTICVTVNLMAAFDTVNHNVLLSKIARSALPEATCRWLSNYIRDRQSLTSCRGIKSKARIIHTGFPARLEVVTYTISFYTADMPLTTEPVRRIYYVDDITVWASGVKISELEQKVNTYLMEMPRFFQANSLLILTPCLFQTQRRPIPARRSRLLTHNFHSRST